jgi:biopolymer transport protein TolQ
VASGLANNLSGGTVLEQQLSLIDLVLHASITVQAVMALLLLASMFSWYMIVNRIIYFAKARSEMYEFEEQFWSGVDLAQLYRDGNERAAESRSMAGMESIFRAGFKEFSRLAQQRDMDAEAVIEGTRRTMRVAMLREEERLERHLAFLASVGSTSPYIGLFGTVWGIMHSFRGLANATQATLATVAPGISEALVATAMGLFAAIPAVLAYNRFASRVDLFVNRYDTFVDEFSSILYRQAIAVRSRNKRAAGE